MISRSTLIGALVVVELAIVGLAARALGAGFSDSSFPTAVAPAGPGGAFGHDWTPSARDQQLPAGPTPSVVIDVHDVDVTIDAEPGIEVRVADQTRKWGWVTGTPPAPVTLARSADGVRISTPDDDGGVHIAFGFWDRQLHVGVPPGARVRVESGGKVVASGLRAPFSAHVSDDSISVSDQQGDVDVHTDDGRIELTDVRGGTVAASTNDGRLIFDHVVADRLEGATSDGRIIASGLRVADGRLTTNDGHVKVGFADGSDATVTLHTDDGGIAINGTTARDDETGNSSHIIQLGSGRGHFAVSSGSGDITVTQGASV
ncbi:MAG TPA: DUF4097 family beta strand repeat-containing protein [Candidatus Sulfotelmatobacter sp.]|nr:DUF4097 family beta strand repeat-containing protein [Candidatus Sulfotelmatobacter sp.]